MVDLNSKMHSVIYIYIKHPEKCAEQHKCYLLLILIYARSWALFYTTGYKL